MKIHFKKILLSFFVIIGFIFYGVYQRLNGDGLLTSIFNLPGASSTQRTSESVSDIYGDKSSSNAPLSFSEGEGQYYKQAQSESVNPPGAATSDKLYRDGQYDGIIADAYYGDIQVRAIIEAGKLTDIQFLSYPSDRSYSIEVNERALPILKSEAIKLQSAKVDIVSGATNTSNAFIISLSSTLSQAVLSADESLAMQSQTQNTQSKVDIITGATNVNTPSTSLSKNQNQNLNQNQSQFQNQTGQNNSVDIVTGATNISSAASTSSSSGQSSTPATSVSSDQNQTIQDDYESDDEYGEDD